MISLYILRSLKGTYGMVMYMGENTRVDISKMNGFDKEMEVFIASVNSNKNKGYYKKIT